MQYPRNGSRYACHFDRQRFSYNNALLRCNFVFVFRWLRKENAARCRDPGGSTSPTGFYLSSTGRSRCTGCTDRTGTFLLGRK